MCRVVRDQVEQTVPISTIVPGDVIHLSAGNPIPAYALVIEAVNFLVSEASITGESFPVEKRAGVILADTPIASRTNWIFLGSSVRREPQRSWPSRLDVEPSSVKASVPQQPEPAALVFDDRGCLSRLQDPVPRVIELGIRFRSAIRCTDGDCYHHRCRVHSDD